MFDFLSRIKTTLNNLWGTATGSPPAVKAEPLKVAKQPQPTTEPTPTPRQTTPEEIQRGLTEFGGGTAPPVASHAASLAQLGNELAQRYPNFDPAFIAALSLRESGGGQNMPEGSNNPYGIMSYDNAGQRSLANYPDFTTPTLGGGPNSQQGLKGTLTSGMYDKAFQSGNLEDFFNVYSPASENASLEDQVATFNELLKYFQRQSEL